MKTIPAVLSSSLRSPVQASLVQDPVHDPNLEEFVAKKPDKKVSDTKKADKNKSQRKKEASHVYWGVLKCYAVRLNTLHRTM